MLVGYVSDERYVAVPEVLFEFVDESRTRDSTEVRSRASGAVYADLEPGTYTAILYKPGYGSKRVQLTLPLDQPHQFRLLRDGLLGYMWPKWVQSGEQAEFRVHAVEAYKLELWRYGWEKELVRPIGWYDEHGPRATMQISPDGDYTQTGIRWNSQGYSSPTHRQYLIAPERSGLYYLHAKGESGAFCSFPWIVAPSAPSADIAVLAANINWNAYNNFGGRSNYIHADGFPPVPTVNARLELKRYTDPRHLHFSAADYPPLSFDRPEPLNMIAEAELITDPIEGRANCHVAPAEWRFLGWLEREGYDYDLYAETQFDAGVLDLDDYKVLAISAHPEYWSAAMYYRLKEWVFTRGGKLMYLGGNGLNCAVEFVDGHAMIVRNGDQGGGFSHMQQFGKESRFDLYYESEANLLGVTCSETGIMTGAPYRALKADHWAFAGTGLQEGDIFGEHCLHMRCPGGASGHETDKITASSPANIELLAKGLNPDEGGAEMVYHQTASGGEVFAVGSISYPSALPVDKHISRITANVLDRFLL